MSSVEVAYSIVGAGPPLYMVHGIGSRKATWEALIKDLRTDFTCVSFDLRGTERVLYLQSPTRWMNWLKTWRHSDSVWGINVFMWLAIHLAVKSGLLTPARILNVWRQSHFSVLQLSLIHI